MQNDCKEMALEAVQNDCKEMALQAVLHGCKDGHCRHEAEHKRVCGDEALVWCETTTMSASRAPTTDEGARCGVHPIAAGIRHNAHASVARVIISCMHHARNNERGSVCTNVFRKDLRDFCSVQREQKLWEPNL